MKTRFHHDHIDCEHTKTYGHIHLYQIGDICCEPGMEVGLHTQVCHEITLVVSGSATCVTNGKKVHIKKGDLHFCKTGDTHAIYADAKEPLRYFYMGFTADFPSPHSLEEAIALLVNGEISEPVIDENDTFSRFCTVFSEFMDMSPFTDRLVKNELENIIFSVARSFSGSASSDYHQSMHPNNLVHDIILYIDRNIRNIDLLSDLSGTFSYSYNYLSHLFTATMRRSLKDYVKEKKFALACEWLTKTDKTITEISDELSFTTIHTFSRAFKNHFGISPAAYRAKNTKKNDKNR